MTAFGQDLLHDLPLTADCVYRDDRIGQIQEIKHVRNPFYLVFLFRDGEASDTDVFPFFLIEFAFLRIVAFKPILKMLCKVCPVGMYIYP